MSAIQISDYVTGVSGLESRCSVLNFSGIFDCLKDVLLEGLQHCQIDLDRTDKRHFVTDYLAYPEAFVLGFAHNSEVEIFVDVLVSLRDDHCVD